MVMAIPIPKRPSGYRHGQCNAPVQVEAFIDLECPFSKKAWSTMLSVTKNYSDDQVSFTVHPLVLADHRQSWDVTKAAVILAAGDSNKFWNVLTFLYERQEKYSKDTFAQQTHVDLYNLLVRFAAEYAGWTDRTAFIQQLKSDEVEQKAKVSIRFGISRGIWSTPTFFINGSEATQLSSSSTLNNWKRVLDPMFE